MPLAITATPPAAAAATWKALAHLIAARPTIRVCDPETNKFDRTRPLTSRLPQHPAAVMLYHRGRAPLLALDFDTKLHSQDVVDADFGRALAWITEAGGVAVTDQSISGGRHILVPLAIGTTASLAEINPLMRLLEARLPSFDKTPMTNPKTGCITAPGSACRQGGHRLLDGPLSVAIDALTTRSEPGLLPRLHMLLGALPAPATDASPTSTDTLRGAGDHTRLDPAYTRTTPLPPRITDYATTGQLPERGTWRSHSEARQSVLAHAVLHGHSLATIRALTAPGRPWHGLAAAYARYRTHADTALERDFAKALAWAAANSPKFRPVRAQDQELHTRGGPQGSPALRAWLAHATAWLDVEYAGHRYRWIGAAIFQALAIHAARSGQVINGVPVVGVGGRSLSLATGLLSETTVWDFLRGIRDRPGAPLIRTRPAQGREADFYALTRQHPARIDDVAVAAARVEDVHAAWKVIGHQHRRIYELIIHRGHTNPLDICAAAHVSTSTGYTSLAALASAGLIVRGRGTVTSGPVSLDTIAAAHRLEELRAERITRHQRQRATWHTWLDIRDAEHGLTTIYAEHASTADDPATPLSGTGEAEYLASVLATGPPPTDEEADTIAMLSDLLGARVVTAGHG
jgi:hypothetical protein